MKTTKSSVRNRSRDRKRGSNPDEGKPDRETGRQGAAKPRSEQEAGKAAQPRDEEKIHAAAPEVACAGAVYPSLQVSVSDGLPTTPGPKDCLSGSLPAKRRRRKKRKAVRPSKQDHQVQLEPVEVAFAEAEEKERAAHGWSINEVAERADVKRGTIQHVEHRRRGVSLRVASRIAGAYGRKLGAFLEVSGKVFNVLLQGLAALGMA